jgi:hypothetical protein
MLKAAGIQSFAVAVYARDHRHVSEQWPTPQQFDHVIVAVHVTEDSFPATAVSHPDFGTLMLFDPTDPDTRWGDLPEDEQGSLALLVAPRGGGLVRVPSSPPNANRREREIEATLDGGGAIKVRIREHALGQTGASFREEHRSNPGPKYRQLLESWIAGDVTGARVTRLDLSDHPSDGAFELELEFSADHYAQLMQQRLLVFRPAIASQRHDLALIEQVRTHPVVLEAHSFEEKSTFTIPAEFAVDELPEPVGLETAFGSYSAKVDLRPGGLLYTRKLVLNRAILPVDQYPAIRKFFEAIRTAEDAAVVLVKK